MNNSKSQFNLILIVLIMTALLSWIMYFKQALQQDTVDIHQFPKTIGTWTSMDIPLTKDEFEILETKNAFVRQYTNSVDKSTVILYLVYSQTNRKVAHPPEICYTGGGLSILEDVHDTIPVHYNNLLIQTNRLRLNKGNYNQIAYYWFKVGNEFTSNYWKEQILIAIDTMLGKHPSSALVRVSAEVNGQDAIKTEKTLKSFIDLISQDLFNYLP
jgi:EpsI family protein